MASSNGSAVLRLVQCLLARDWPAVPSDENSRLASRKLDILAEKTARQSSQDPWARRFNYHILNLILIKEQEVKKEDEE